MRSRLAPHLVALSVGVLLLPAACGGDSGAPKVHARIPVGDGAHWLAAGEGAVWVGQVGGVVVRLEPATGRATPADIAGLSGLAVGEGAAWATGTKGLSRLDAKSGKVTATIPMGGVPGAVAVGEGSVWVVVGAGSVARVDPAANRLESTIVVGQGLQGLAVGEGAAWATNPEHAEVARVDASASQWMGTVRVGVGPHGVAVGHGSIWVADTVVSTVSRIDPGTSRVSATIELADPPSGIATGEGAVWVARQEPKGVVSRIDPATNQVIARVSIGRSLAGVAVGEGSVWAVQAKPGTLARIAAVPTSASAEAIPTTEAPAVIDFRRTGGIAGFLDRLSVDLVTGHATLKQGIGDSTVFGVPPTLSPFSAPRRGAHASVTFERPMGVRRAPTSSSTRSPTGDGRSVRLTAPFRIGFNPS